MFCYIKKSYAFLIAHCCTHALSNKQKNAIPMDLDGRGVRTMQASENICTWFRHFIFISFGQLYNKKHVSLIIMDFKIWILFRYLITNFGKENINISHLFLIVKFGKSIFFIFLKSFCEALYRKQVRCSLLFIYLVESFQQKWIGQSCNVSC